MARQLDAASNGEPWSVMGVVFGLDLVRDDEGRPISERRAGSAAKKGVTLELRSCPYADERNGSPMNVSALAQITRHLDTVTNDLAAFRNGVALDPATATGWDPMYVTVIDQLAAPAIHLLRLRDPEQRVPASKAVAHKLAAGYYSAFARLLEQGARGRAREVSTASFLEFIATERLLIGASEVCAGPPHMIARLTETLVRGTSGPALRDASRFLVARSLATQVQLGCAWELLDEALEREVLGWHAEGLLRPRNAYIAGRLADRAERLGAVDRVPHERVCSAVPRGSRGIDAEALVASVRACLASTGSDAEGAHVIAELLAHGEGALELAGGARELVARRIAAYLAVYRRLVGALWALELGLRAELGYPLDAPIRLHVAVLPAVRGLDWFEAILGHRLECTPLDGAEVRFRNHHRVVRVLHAASSGT